MMKQGITRRQALATAVLVVALSVGGAAAVAGTAPTFTDVPEEHPFSAEIEAIAAAGITTGFSDGTYRPGGTVSRGAMAAFMGRGFTRIGHDTDDNAAPLTAAEPEVLLADVVVDAGATQSGEGYVLLIGQVSLLTDDPGANCPCTAQISIVGLGGVPMGDSVFIQLGSEPGSDGGFGDANGTVVAAVPIDADTSLPFGLEVEAIGLGAGDEVEAFGTLSAVYAPFASSEASTPTLPEGPLAEGAGRG